jgi:ribosome-associated toxin RatA of RatAB toxin-antitoxin module
MNIAKIFNINNKLTSQYLTEIFFSQVSLSKKHQVGTGLIKKKVKRLVGTWEFVISLLSG